MKSKLSTHIRQFGDESIFVRTGPGRYFLRALLDRSPVREYKSPPFRAGPPRERVVVIPQQLLDEYGRFQGIAADWETYYEAFTGSGRQVRMDRMAAEDSSDFKQLLTYILVRRGDGALLCFDRGVVNRVDDDLRGRACVGFGGHVKHTDPTLFDPDDVGLFRSGADELTEELWLPAEDYEFLRSDPRQALTPLGVLNDDSSSNGLRHFAFVLEYRLRSSDLEQRPVGKEKSINRVRWLTVSSARRASVHRFEYWSQLCLREYAPDLADATPSFQVRRRLPLKTAKAVCLVGQIGSGKTEAAAGLRSELKLAEINSGRVLASLLGVPPVPETPREEFQALANDFIRRESGPFELGGAIAAAASSSPGRVLIDGLRQLETLEALRSRLGRANVAVIYVQAPFDIAFEWYRLREDPTVSAATFARRRSSQVESEVGRFIDVADAALFNWIGRDAYAAAVQELARSYIQ